MKKELCIVAIFFFIDVLRHNLHTYFFYNCSNNISFEIIIVIIIISIRQSISRKKNIFFTDVYPGQPPPPYDSQGETYHRLTADDEADTSPMDVIAEPLNSYRYPKARRSRHLGMYLNYTLALLE